jgi:hypothetical protein
MNALHSIRARPRRWRRRTVLSALAVMLGSLTVLVGAAVADTAPTNTSLPTITGVTQQGHALTIQSGSWSGTNPIVFTYQWRRCNTSGASCANISSATGQTYTLAAADVGFTLRISVTATNSAGTASVLSDPSAVVGALNAPRNVSAPSISGTAQQGSTLTANNGSWSGSTPISYSYRWQLCDSHGAGCGFIGGASSQTYVPASGDVGHTVRVEVTATNSVGSYAAVSGSSAVIVTPGNAPASTKPPTLSGSFVEGSAITASQGEWSGAAPITYSYGWQRCDASGNNCSGIAGADGSNYTLVRADVGNRVRGVVTASNTLGNTTAYSSLGGVVGSTREPVNTVLPLITGTPALNQTLSATVGSWSGASPFQYSYQWARGNAKGGYDPIDRATQQTYKLTGDDVGHQLYVQVKAQNKYGPAWATSKPSATITSTVAAPGAVSVDTVSLPNRLVITQVKFNPTIVRSRNPFQVRFVVADSSGHPVQGALVKTLGLPYGWVRNVAEQRTGADGSVTLTIVPTVRLPIGGKNALVMFVRARKPGGSVLAGVSTRRLVQVRLR